MDELGELLKQLPQQPWFWEECSVRSRESRKLCNLAAQFIGVDNRQNR